MKDFSLCLKRFFLSALLSPVLLIQPLYGKPDKKPDPKDSLVTTITRMGLFDLNAGVNYRSAGKSNQNFPSSLQTDYAMGFSARMQSSIIWNYFVKRGQYSNGKKFYWGDILSAEVFTGKLSTTLQHETGSLWVAYQFEFGFGGRWTIGKQSELGLNLILIKFSRDDVSGNISGSGILGRYRYKRIMAEAGVEARHTRAFGVVIDARDKVPLQSLWTLRYLMRHGRNIGVTAESLPGNYLQDSVQYSRIWSVKIFYGIYF